VSEKKMMVMMKEQVMLSERESGKNQRKVRFFFIQLIKDS